MTNFLRLLHRDANPKDLVELRVTPANRGGALLDRRFVAVSDPALPAVIGAILARNRQVPSMVAFGVNPRARAGGADADVSSVVAICADLDGGRAPLAGQLSRLRQIARGAPPFAVVASGSQHDGDDHLHAYWRIAPPSDPDLARGIGRQLRRFLGSDPSEPPSKMMRLPESLNWKGGHGTRCEVRALRKDAAIEIGALRAILERLGASSKTDAPPAARAPSGNTYPAPDCISPAHMRTVITALPNWARDLILRGWLPGSRYLSRSEADAAACCALANAGATDAEVLHLFKTYPIGAKYRERGAGYLLRTLDFGRSCAEVALAKPAPGVVRANLVTPRVSPRGLGRGYISRS